MRPEHTGATTIDAAAPAAASTDGLPRRDALDRLLASYLWATKRIVVAFSIVILVIMVAVNGLEISARALFESSISWVQEISILSAMWIYFMTYSLIAKDEEYIRVDFLANLLGAGARRVVGIFARLMTILFHAIVVWFAVVTYKFSEGFTTTVLGWPEGLFILPIMLGAADIAITELIYLYWQVIGREIRRPTQVLAEAD